MSLQVEHKTEKGTILFFLPPIGSDRFKMFPDYGSQPYLSYFVGADTHREYLNDVGFKLIGLSTEITEENAKMMLGDNKSILTSLMLFKSLMQHLEVYEVNPYDNHECDNHWCDNGYIDMGYNEKMRCQFCQENEDRQDEAESRVRKWIVLFKEN